MKTLQASVLLVCVGLLVFWLQYPEPVSVARVVPAALKASEPSEVQRPVEPERAPVTIQDGPREFKIADLTGLHEKNITLLNRVMKKSGRREVGPDATISDDELGQLADMLSASSDAINEAADAVLDFQEPYAEKMGSVIKEAVDAGKPVPYKVLLKGVLPKNRRPYDQFVTTSYLGVVYLLTVPVSADLMELVDQRKMTEELRLEAFTSFAANLK